MENSTVETIGTCTNSRSEALSSDTIIGAIFVGFLLCAVLVSVMLLLRYVKKVEKELDLKKDKEEGQ